MWSRLLIFALIFSFIGCGSNPLISNSKSEKPAIEYIPEYVAISPITIPPLAAKIKSSLLEIATNTKGTESMPYDIDLLVLPTSISKAQYRFFEFDAGVSAALGSFSGSATRRRAVYDIMHMASHPMPIILPARENAVARKIIVTPFVGVGVRITVEYNTSGIKGNLSLAALAAELKARNGQGSIEIQQLGISRYGTNNQGLSGIDITPENIETIFRNINYLMGQVWLQDTRVQPMIVGYSIPGYTDIPSKYHPDIVEQIATPARIKEILTPFIESMYYEAKSVYKISGKLVNVNAADSTDYNKVLASLEEDIGLAQKRADVTTMVALTEPELVKEITTPILEKFVKTTGENTVTASQAIITQLKSSE